LVVPPAAKKKRTTKKVLVEVTFFLSWTQDHSYSDKFHPVQFQTRTQQPSASEPANASSIGMTFITSFSFKDHYLHWHLLFIWHLQKKYWWTILWKPPLLNTQVHQGLNHLLLK
jgi:hypothetical protein